MCRCIGNHGDEQDEETNEDKGTAHDHTYQTPGHVPALVCDVYSVDGHADDTSHS